MWPRTRQINLPDQIVVLMLVGLLICTASVYYAMTQIYLRIDQRAATESVNRVAERVATLRDQVRVFSLDYNNWSDAHDAAMRGDLDFLSDNYGITALQGRIFDLAEIYAGPFQEPMAWVKNGDRLPGPNSLPDTLLLRIEEILDQQGVSRPHHDFIFGSGDGISIASAARLLPDPNIELKTDDIAHAPIAIIARKLSESDLAAISSAAGVTGLTVSRSLAEGPSQLSLADVNGEPGWYLSWQAPRPSVFMTRELIPVMAILAAALMSLAALATWLVRRNAHNLVQREVEARKMARTDMLTGLANRLALNEFMQARSKLTGQEATFVMLDLDRLKQTNDILGHAVGDTVLRVFAEKIRICADRNSFIARLGGDEFCAIISGPASMERARAFVTGLDICAAAKIELDGDHLALSFTAGVAHQLDSDRPEEALRKADLAMRRTKSDPNLNIGIYDDNMDLADKSTFLIEQALRRALSTPEQFSVVYQPIQCAENGKIVAMEALARWTHPVLGVISPEKFIPIAEDSNMISDLGWIIIEHVLKDMQKRPDIRVMINVSPLQIMDSRFLPQMLTRLDKHRIDVKRVVFELTERVMIGNPEDITANIADIREAGIWVALDDFGTGFSAISYLTAAKFDIIKIDGSLIQKAADNAEFSRLAAAVVALCRAVCDCVVVEGAETAEQAELARQIGGTALQGYFVGSPDQMNNLHNDIADPMSASNIAILPQSRLSPKRRKPTGQQDSEPSGDDFIDA